ncbi:receptor-like protein EIX1 [Ziziphus jujuba]|uniref:Receptor-like protein EIX1 n=1 Tax=Ziziphus jujuba TaxID=326968 RepID=A0ABM4A165_ZIZJJ|nr:receptor-like protein EIX1 [Ziziphus jujuba]
MTREFLPNTNAHLMNCWELDREALIAFKNGLNDPANRLSSWKGSNFDLRDPHQDGFQFFGSGAIPQTFGNLSSLQYLDLDNSLTLEWQLGLYVDNLDWVTGLVSLKHLDMDAVDLSNVGSHWIMKLNKLSSLTELHLSDCSLSGPIPPLTFVNLTSLVVLDLMSNELNSKIPDWLFLYLGHNDLTASCHQLLGGRWEKIQELDLESISLHGKLPASTGNMTFLTFLNLFSNNVKGGIPSFIGKLFNLVYFDIGKNNLTGTLPEFLEGIENCLSRRPLPSLQVLHLPNNHLVGKSPECLTQLANLVELDLSSGNSLCGPIPASFGILQQNVTYLNLNEDELNGTLPESLGQLSKLSFLDVSSNRLTGIVTETHFLNLEKLRVLDLSSNSFTLAVNSNWVPPFQVETLHMDSCHMGPSFPAWLKSQKRLTDLNLSNTSISGSIPHWFWEHFLNLSTLNVSNNHLEGHLRSHLNYAPTLDIGTVASFDLSSNNFSGASPILSGNFWIIDLSKNKFSSTTPNDISFSNYLKFLFISDNQISGEIPPSIGKNYWYLSY